MTDRAGGAPVDKPTPPARRGFDHEVSRILTKALAEDDARRSLEQTERQFQDKIVELARHPAFGWLVVHHGGNQHRRAHYDTTGFPDLLMISPHGRVLFREIKTDKGRLTPAQQRWESELLGRHADHKVWRPADWDQIATELTDGRAVPQ